MNVEKIQDLQSAGKLETQESQRCSCSSKASKLATEEELMLQLESGGRSSDDPFKAVRSWWGGAVFHSAFLFSSGLHLGRQEAPH